MSRTCTCTHPRPPTPTPTHPSTHTHTHLGGLHEHKPCIQHALQLFHLMVQCLCHLLLFQLIPRTPRKMMNVVSMQGKYVNPALQPCCTSFCYLHSLKAATGEKELRPGARTCTLHSNAEFEPRNHHCGHNSSPPIAVYTTMLPAQ